MKSCVRILGFLALITLGAGSAHGSALKLKIDRSGILRGARNVDVGGLLYDVVFRDGTCDELSICAGDPLSFTLDQALLANDALMTQVFTDSKRGAFDSRPELTAGCGPVSGEAFPTCYVVTTVKSSDRFSTLLEGVINHGLDGGNDETAVAYLQNGLNTLNRPLGREMVFAVWQVHRSRQPSASPVATPEPASLTMLGLGIGLLGLLRLGSRIHARGRRA